MTPPALRILPAPRRERGAALLIILTIIGLGAAFLLVSALNKANLQIERDKAAYATLAQAKEALIAWAITRPDSSNKMGILPNPDELDPAETPPLNYDGNTNVGCLSTTWTPGAALTGSGGNMRCLGRLPWNALGLNIASPSQNDPNGTMPWYAVSGNLVDTCTDIVINPGLLNTAFTGYTACLSGNPRPYPWLTVHDERGNILSNRVAAVIFYPGPAIGGQTRPAAPLSGPAVYLDSVTVAAGCAAPCVPGNYNNARLNPGNDFIVGKDSRLVSATDPNYAQPYNFNDKVVYITIDELMAAAEKRAAGEVAARLRTYYASNYYFPYAAGLGTNNCSNLTTRGFIPTSAGNCTHPAFPMLGTFPTWFSGNNWQNYFYYSVAPGCTQATPGTPSNCGGAGRLTVGTNNNVRALIITTGRPVANITGQTPSMTTPPYAASKPTSDQTGFSSANINDYLDSSENTNGDDTYDAVGTARNTTYNDQMIVVAP